MKIFILLFVVSILASCESQNVINEQSDLERGREQSLQKQRENIIVPPDPSNSGQFNRNMWNDTSKTINFNW